MDFIVTPTVQPEDYEAFSDALREAHILEPIEALRYDTGKPDFSLLPLWVVAGEHARCGCHGPALNALFSLAGFQRSHDVSYLFTAMSDLGNWSETARVLEFGRHKYAAWNWSKGMAWSRCVASCARHLVAHLDGETADPESGLPHLAHAQCNLTFLATYSSTHPELNDLPNPGTI